ncbi:uncharacterized protein V1510DRAFT_124520 [Dipodascopsis tothii]|uniref:uncharacterized protein n=1 Tax=Dipodascopsis tothii TaxID=44089 RepID=UPI0034CD6675
MAAKQSVLETVLAEAEFNERRLPSLYSDFRPLRESNVDGWEANVAAWAGALRRTVRSGRLAGDGDERDVLTLHAGPALVQALTSPSLGKPLALQAVLDELVRTGELVPRAAFDVRPGLTRRALALGAAAAAWAFRHTPAYEYYAAYTDGRPPPAVAATDYVVVANMRDAAATVVARAQQPPTCGPAALRALSARFRPVYTVGVVRELFGAAPFGAAGVQLSAADVDVLVAHAVATGQAARDGDVVRFGPGRVSDDDRAVAAVKQAVVDAWRRVEAQTHIATSHRAAVRRLVAARVDGQPAPPAMEKYHLRAARAAEAGVASASASLLQLEDLLAKLDSAAGHAEMAALMEQSASALVALNAEAGGVERAEAAAAALDDAVADADAIGEALTGPPDADVEADVEAEWDALVAEAAAADAAAAPAAGADVETGADADLVAALSGLGLDRVPALDKPQRAPAQPDHA